MNGTRRSSSYYSQATKVSGRSAAKSAEDRPLTFVVQLYHQDHVRTSQQAPDIAAADVDLKMRFPVHATAGGRTPCGLYLAIPRRQPRHQRESGKCPPDEKAGGTIWAQAYEHAESVARYDGSLSRSMDSIVQKERTMNVMMIERLKELSEVNLHEPWIISRRIFTQTHTWALTSRSREDPAPPQLCRSVLPSEPLKALRNAGTIWPPSHQPCHLRRARQKHGHTHHRRA